MATIAKQIKLAIVGATGFIGREVLKTLDESELLLIDPLLLAQGDDVGEVLTCQGADMTTDSLEEADFSAVDIALFCGPPETTKKYAPKALKAGVIAIDGSGALRGSGIFLKGADQMPNPNDLRAKGGFLPNSLAVSLAMVLGAIHKKMPLLEATVSTYQTVGGAGMGAVQEVAEQSVGLLGGAVAEGGFIGNHFAHQAAFNVLPHVGSFLENGQTSAEAETAADFAALTGVKIPLSVGCAYVPIFVGDGLDVTLRFADKKAPSAAEIRKLFNPASGVMVLDDVAQNEYATPYGAAETSYVFVSRVRQDPAHENGIKLWIVADHIRIALARQLVKYAETIAHEVLQKK